MRKREERRRLGARACAEALLLLLLLFGFELLQRVEEQLLRLVHHLAEERQVALLLAGRLRQAHAQTRVLTLEQSIRMRVRVRVSAEKSRRVASRQSRLDGLISNQTSLQSVEKLQLDTQVLARHQSSVALARKYTQLDSDFNNKTYGYTSIQTKFRRVRMRLNRAD